MLDSSRFTSVVPTVSYRPPRMNLVSLQVLGHHPLYNLVQLGISLIIDYFCWD